jgi:hypothetical protein
MQYLFQLYIDGSIWPRMTPEERERGTASYMAYSEALQKAGAYVDGNRLESGISTLVKVSPEGKTSVLDGPYADTKEQIGGYYIIEAPDLDAALAWAARCPTASHGTVEVRPIAEM